MPLMWKFIILASIAMVAHGQNTDFDDLKVYDVLTLDPDQLRKAPKIEVESELERLQSRDESDDYNLKYFNEFNKSLCKELRSLRKTCPAIVRVIPSQGGDQVNCPGMEGFVAEDGSYPMNFTVTLEGDQGGEFRLEVGKLASDAFSSGTHNVQFERVADKSFLLSSRFMDLEYLRLVAVSGDTSLPDEAFLTFKINDVVLYDRVSLKIPTQGGSKTYLEMSAADIHAPSLDESCRMTDEKLLKISQDIHQSLGGRP